MSRRRTNDETVAECLNALQTAAAQLGETPTKLEYKVLGLSPSASVIARRCGSWAHALSLADLDPPSRNQYTRKDCLQALRNFVDTHGEEPTIQSYEQSGYKPSVTTIAERCGSWSEAKELAGVLNSEEVDKTPEEEADEMFDLLEQATPVRHSDSTHG